MQKEKDVQESKTKLPEKFAYWHGIPREEIQWFPTINESVCIGCKLCFVSCGRNVFDFDFERKKAVVKNPYYCMVGCSTCATICPSQAISFPQREYVQKIEREHKILIRVQEIAREKKTKLDLEKARKEAMETISKVRSEVKFEVTGHIAERRIMQKLYDFLEEKPCDVVDIRIQTATLKGCWNEKAPSYMRFTLASIQFEDVTDCEHSLEKILEENGMVIVNKD